MYYVAILMYLTTYFEAELLSNICNYVHTYLVVVLHGQTFLCMALMDSVKYISAWKLATQNYITKPSNSDFIVYDFIHTYLYMSKQVNYTYVRIATYIHRNMHRSYYDYKMI